MVPDIATTGMKGSGYIDTIEEQVNIEHSGNLGFMIVL